MEAEGIGSYTIAILPGKELATFLPGTGNPIENNIMNYCVSRASVKNGKLQKLRLKKDVIPRKGPGENWSVIHHFEKNIPMVLKKGINVEILHEENGWLLINDKSVSEEFDGPGLWIQN